MNCKRWFFGSLVVGLAIAISAGGCAKEGPNKDSSTAENAKNQKGKSEPQVAKGSGHDLNGYWCVEHGIPEEECSLCSAEKAAEFKALGDWCEEHDRAESQCFKCDPSRYDRFAAKYRAKFGKEPPRPPESEFQK